MNQLRNGSTKLVPMNRLPSELLVSIFSIAVNTSPPSRTTCDSHGISFLHTISSVSSYWRHLSLATPAFWTDIYFARNGGLKHAALWVGRSRSCPLSLASQERMFSKYNSKMYDLI
ncbi:hypothetical protein BDV93DRAFT_529991 [Ceratobasidium sp. AG-I]|nr:hypothetical protein BDV93DRAFT_529991 [Ceratobasidium sp. AG-I]